MDEKIYGYLWLEDGSEIDLEGQSKQEILAQLTSPIKSIGAHELEEEANVYVKYPGGKSKTLLSPEEVTAFLNEKEEELEENIQVSMDDIERKPDDVAKIAEKSDVVVKLDENKQNKNKTKIMNTKEQKIKALTEAIELITKKRVVLGESYDPSENEEYEGYGEVKKKGKKPQTLPISNPKPEIKKLKEAAGDTQSLTQIAQISVGIYVNRLESLARVWRSELEQLKAGTSPYLTSENDMKELITNMRTKNNQIDTLEENKQSLREEMTTGDMAIGEGSVGGVMKNKPKTNLTEGLMGSLEDVAGKTLVSDEDENTVFYFADDYVEVSKDNRVIATCHYSNPLDEEQDGLEEAANTENNNPAIRVESEEVNSGTNDYLDEILDILSSGQGDYLSPQAEQEITKVYTTIPENLRDKVWSYYIMALNNEEIGVLKPGELSIMCNVFRKPKPRLVESKQSKRKKVIAENSYSELIEVRGRKVIKEAKEVLGSEVSDNSIEMVNIDTPTLGNIMPNSVIKAIDGYVSQTLAEIDRATTDLRAVKKSITNSATASDESFTTQTERIAFLLKQLSRVQLYCSNTIKANRFDKGLLDKIMDQKALQNEVK